MNLTHFSASQMETFARCRTKWFLDKVARIPGDGEVRHYTVRGSAVHYALEEFARNGVVPKDSIPTYIANAPEWPASREWNGRVYDNPTKAELANHAIQIANALLPYVQHTGDCVEVEILLPTAPGVPPVKGYIDVYDVATATITDWKVRSRHKQNGKKSKQDLCDEHLALYEECGCEGTLHDDIQMNVYARHMLLQNEALSAVKVRHVYAGSSGAPSPYAVEDTITREANSLRWEDLVSLMRDMTKTAEIKFGDVPRNYDACGDYGGCPYRDMCFDAEGFTIMTRTDLTANLLAGGQDPINPSAGIKGALLGVSEFGIVALCDQLRTHMKQDLRGAPQEMQVEGLVAYFAPFGQEVADGWIAWAHQNYPVKAPEPPPPPPPPPAPKAPEPPAPKAPEPPAPKAPEPPALKAPAPPQAPPAPAQPPATQGSWNAQLRAHMGALGLKRLRNMIAFDSAPVLTPEYREVQQEIRNQLKPAQNVCYKAVIEEYAARGIAAEEFDALFAPAPVAAAVEKAPSVVKGGARPVVSSGAATRSGKEMERTLLELHPVHPKELDSSHAGTLAWLSEQGAVKRTASGWTITAKTIPEWERVRNAHLEARKTPAESSVRDVVSKLFQPSTSTGGDDALSTSELVDQPEAGDDALPTSELVDQPEAGDDALPTSELVDQPEAGDDALPTSELVDPMEEAAKAAAACYYKSLGSTLTWEKQKDQSTWRAVVKAILAALANA